MMDNYSTKIYNIIEQFKSQHVEHKLRFLISKWRSKKYDWNSFCQCFKSLMH